MKKPNVLLLWTDQQRADSISALGGVPGLTPHFDRLVSASTVFENAYCAQPVCTPSRATVMSGLWPHQHGCVHNNDRFPADRPTLAERAPEGYQTGYFGKWHLGDEIIAQRGFSDWVSIEDAIYRPYYSKPEYLERRSDYHAFLVENGYEPDGKAKDGARVFSRPFAANLPEPFTKSHFLAATLEERCRTVDQSRPFFWSVNMFEPHTPFTGPHNDLLDPESLPVGDAFAVPPAPDHSERNRRKAEVIAAKNFEGMEAQTAADFRRIRARYWGLVKLVDNALGRMLNALESNGLLDNTIIVFCSDHGEMAGDHALLTKSVMYNEASRVPLMIRLPGGAGQRIAAPASLIDVVPTLMDAMGLPPDPALPGQSLLPVAQGATYEPRDVVVEWCSRGQGAEHAELAADRRVATQQWRSLVAPDGWKLNRSDDDTPELFNLHDDPCELVNRAGDAGCRDRLEAMTVRLRAWQQRHQDTCELK